MKYFISQNLINRSDDLVKTTDLALPKKRGFIRLYQDNGWRTSYFKIIKRADNRFGWIVERKTKFDPYWKHVIHKES